MPPSSLIITAYGAPMVHFLNLVAHSEGTTSNPLTQFDGYDSLANSIHGPAVFTDFTDHPFAHGRPPQLVRKVPLLESTAAGRYQLMLHQWLAYKRTLGLVFFSPANQDRVACQQIEETGAIPHIDADDIKTAIEKCAHLWASFPGNDYGQGGKSMDELCAWWHDEDNQTASLA